jgi:hypothetical protein
MRWILTILAILLIAAPAAAHSPQERMEWWAQWHQEVRIAGGLTPGLLDEAIAFTKRHDPPPPTTASVTAAAPRRPVAAPASVEAWRPLVAANFPAAAVEAMLCLMHHESRGDPNAVNPSSGAAGLFQIMPFWWDHYGGDRFDPATNVAVARLIWDQQGYAAWSPWNRGLCR